MLRITTPPGRGSTPGESEGTAEVCVMEPGVLACSARRTELSSMGGWVTKYAKLGSTLHIEEPPRSAATHPVFALSLTPEDSFRFASTTASDDKRE